jgi:gluconolactonase
LSAKRLRWDVVAEGLAFPEGPVALNDGSLLVSEMAAGRITRVWPDGSTAPVVATGGGPNGLAATPDGGLLVCQSGGSGWSMRPWPYDGPGSVELFLPSGPADEPLAPQVQFVSADGTITTRFGSGGDVALLKPSDIVIDREGGVYLTDFGGIRGRSRTIGGVLYAPPGGNLREIVFPVELANGVALAPGEVELHVTETRTRRVWGFELTGPGEVGAWRSIATVPAGGPIGFGSADGCAVDVAGGIAVATIGLGGVTIVDRDGTVIAAGPVAGDPMPTNVVFGGSSGSTIFVTCGSSGRVLATDDWDVPGVIPPVAPPAFA